MLDETGGLSWLQSRNSEVVKVDCQHHSQHYVGSLPNLRTALTPCCRLPHVTGVPLRFALVQRGGAAHEATTREPSQRCSGVPFGPGYAAWDGGLAPVSQTRQRPGGNWQVAFLGRAPKSAIVVNESSPEPKRACKEPLLEPRRQGQGRMREGERRHLGRLSSDLPGHAAQVRDTDARHVGLGVAGPDVMCEPRKISSWNGPLSAELALHCRRSSGAGQPVQPPPLEVTLQLKTKACAYVRWRWTCVSLAVS